MNVYEKLSAPLRGAEHYNQIEPSANVRKSLDTTGSPYSSKVHDFDGPSQLKWVQDLSQLVESATCSSF